MPNSILKESVMAGILATLLILIVNPLHLWMPGVAHMIIFAVLFGVFGAYASFVLRENAEDEREILHRMKAGRAAFLTGSGILVLGITLQGIRHATDPWLPAALAGMIFAKLAARAWSDRRM